MENKRAVNVDVIAESKDRYEIHINNQPAAWGSQNRVNEIIGRMVNRNDDSINLYINYKRLK